MISETVQLALVAAGGGFVTGLIPSIFAYLSLQTARQAAAEAAAKESAAAAAKLAEVNKKSDIIIGKAVEIHALTNSNLSQVTASLEVANTRIEGLKNLVMSMVEAKKVTDLDASKRIEAATLDRNGRLDELVSKVEEGTTVSLRIEEAASGVADDLAKAHQRADEHAGDEAGAAADASARQTVKEKRLAESDE